MTAAAPSTTSERIASGSLLPAVVMLIVVTLVLSFIYGPLEHWSPLVYLNIVLTFGYGFAVGKVGQYFLRSRHIDNRRSALILGLVGGVAAVWLAWLSYFWVITGYQTSEYFIAMNPSVLWEVMDFLAEDPMWSIGKSTMPAMVYWGVWCVEAVFIIGVSTMMCSSFVDENQRCETCGEWVAATGDVCYFDPGDNADILFAEFRNGNPAPLARLTRLDPEALPDSWVETRGRACPLCEKQDMLVDIIHIVMKKGKKKEEPERNETVLAKGVVISKELEDILFAQTTPTSAMADNSPGQPE